MPVRPPSVGTSGPCPPPRSRHAAPYLSQADTLWAFFSRPHGGAALLLDAWRLHAELRPDGVLLPLVLHFSGEHLDRFFTHVLPRHLPAPGAYWSFTLELLPLLAGSDGTRSFLAQSGTLRFLLQASPAPAPAPL